MRAIGKLANTMLHVRSRRSRRFPRGYEPVPGQPLRIYFVGTDEQQDRSGILQALERLGQLRYFTRADGSYGQNDPRPGEVRRRALSERLWEQIAAAGARGEAPNVLIAQTWASVIDPQVLARIKSNVRNAHHQHLDG